MRIGHFLLPRFFLLALVFSPLPLELWPQDTQGYRGEHPAQNSGSALNRLIEISNQLSSLNEKLQGELLDSRKSSLELQSMLESSKKELASLRQELITLKQEAAALQSSSTELLTKAESSHTELTLLREALRKAESSLMNLEISFASYRNLAEKRIKTLEKEKTFWKWGCIAAGVLAAGFGTAWLVTR